MIIDLSNGDKPIKVPRDLISMGDVHDILGLFCKRKDKNIMFALKDRNIKIYKVASDYYCSKQDISSTGINQALSQAMLDVIACLATKPMETEELMRELDKPYESVIYRLNRLLDYNIIERQGHNRRKKNKNTYNYVIYGLKPELVPLYTKQNRI